jgi:mersacidin/lichenicidin family type 2 lantibiotic
MANVDIIRAWKDEEYFNSLSEAERAALPVHPSGLIELADEDLRGLSGGSDSTVESCTFPRAICTKVNCTMTEVCATTPMDGCS